LLKINDNILNLPYLLFIVEMGRGRKNEGIRNGCSFDFIQLEFGIENNALAIARYFEMLLFLKSMRYSVIGFSNYNTSCPQFINICIII
jgi:hypothetical protein